MIVPDKLMEAKDINLLISGEAGQGLVTIGQMLAKSLVRSGYAIVVTQSYQSRIRGGHNTFAIRFGAGEISAPREEIDLLISLDADSIKLHETELSPHGVIIVDEAIDASGVECKACLSVPYETFGSKRYVNVAALGVTGALLGLDVKLLEKIVHKIFGKKGDKVADDNSRVLEKAYAWGREQQTTVPKPGAGANPADRLMMNGNEAIAMGAISAGVKSGFFYPMTPSTSVMIGLAAQARKMGLIIEQAEDEIAAINMAIGASFAGAPSMVSTSGGGFALMAEGVSLAAMTETPVVIVVAQRPGPATGLPTRTEQGDLEFILHAGHGEFPRAVFAPGDVEECFHLARKAFFLAERFQGPMFILTDQFLADSYRAVERIDVESLEYVKPGAASNSVPVPYRRYALVEGGVSPRLLPGASEHLVVADSDEHTEDGHLTEDLGIRNKMVQKRLAKHGGILQEVVPPQWQGDEKPETLLVSWGSSKGAVQEAAASLRAEGGRIATLHFSQVWPLNPSQFTDRFEEAGQVVCIEGNAGGQFARLIRRETGFDISRRVLRYDGLPMTPRSILRVLT